MQQKGEALNESSAACMLVACIQRVTLDVQIGELLNANGEAVNMRKP